MGNPTSSNSSATRSVRAALPSTRSCTDSGSAIDVATRARGFSEENGSWNTSPIRRRNARAADPLAPNTSVPSSVAVPPSGRANPVNAAATVDLPEPDSPTSPSVAPRRTVNDTSRTACTVDRPTGVDTVKRTSRPSTVNNSSVPVTSGGPCASSTGLAANRSRV